MLNFLDSQLNKITMYRLLLYYLLVLVFVGLFVKGLPLLFSLIFILLLGYLVNKVFALTFKAPTNTESVYLSALILVLIINPPQSVHDLPFLFWATVWTMAGKYIIAYKKKHLFNPAAFGVFLSALFLNQSATWWIGTSAMLPFVLLGGLLIAYKIQRLEMVLTYVISLTLTTLFFSFNSGINLLFLLSRLLTESPMIFFASVMLTEPLTTPPTRDRRFLYAIFAGVLSESKIATPETALIIANLFSFWVSFKGRLTLKLIEKKKIAPEIVDYIFSPDRKINYQPGQYLEWTLPHHHPDSRGNRRYFTLASSPTENTLRIGVKFAQNPSSSFKSQLSRLNINDTIMAHSLAGDFTLPAQKETKLAFIAGGIGITPFRSMLKYLEDSGEKRDVIILYSAHSADEFVYQDVLNRFPTHYKTGHLDITDIQENIPDYRERLFYLSGPQAMVNSFSKALKDLQVPASHLKKDYFPGF